MSLKRALGMMLASRMAGRGGAMRGGLGTAGALGMLGGRRRGLGGKLGLAALGYMAYKAYQDHQASSTRGSGHTGGIATRGSSAGGGLAGMVKDVADRLTGNDSDASPAYHEEKHAAEAMSEDRALLLIRAMITAAYADGSLSHEERERIVGQLDETSEPTDRDTIHREMGNPQPLETLLAQVNDHDTALEFYLASRAALDGDRPQDQEYLARLRDRLGIDEEEARDIDEMAA